MPPFSAPKPVSYVDMRLATISGESISTESISAKSVTPREVLVAVGDLARRTEQHSAPDGVLEKALATLSAEQVILALSELDASTTDETMTRAAAEAFEAAFADSEEERELFSESASAGLAMRDRVESTVFAARAFAKMSAESSSSRAVVEAADACDARFVLVDRAITEKHARSLTGINSKRRQCYEELDGAARERAVWFSLGLDKDDLLLALAGDAKSPAPSASVQADLALAKLPEMIKKPGQKRSFEETESSALYRATLGTWSTEERVFLERRALADAALKNALRESLSADDASDASLSIESDDGSAH